MSGVPQLTPALATQRSTGASVAKILYGSGLRLMECLRLRVKDIDFGNHQIIVRDGKGEDDRATILPDSIVPALQKQIETVQRIHQTDLGDGFGEVHLPYALARKYPNAARETAWQYLFPASSLSVSPFPSGRGVGGEGKKTMRHHADESLLQKAVRAAAKAAEIDKHVTPHTLRQCGAYL